MSARLIPFFIPLTPLNIFKDDHNLALPGPCPRRYRMSHSCTSLVTVLTLHPSAWDPFHPYCDP